MKGDVKLGTLCLSSKETDINEFLELIVIISGHSWDSPPSTVKLNEYVCLGVTNVCLVDSSVCKLGGTIPHAPGALINMPAS